MEEKIDYLQDDIFSLERLIPNAGREMQKAVEEYLKQNVSIIFHKMEEGLIRAELKQRMFDNIFGEKK